MQTTTLICIVSLLLFDAESAAGLSAPPRPPRQTQLLVTPDSSPPSLNRSKVPGESPASYYSDPSDDSFQIRRLDFIPTNPRIGYHLTSHFIGNFVSPTGSIPWLNITGSVNGRTERSPLYYSPLCHIDVFQNIEIQSPAGNYDQQPRLHRSCPPGIAPGYAVVSSPPMPLSPLTVPEARYEIRAEATTQDGRRIFCVEGGLML